MQPVTVAASTASTANFRTRCIPDMWGSTGRGNSSASPVNGPCGTALTRLHRALGKAQVKLRGKAAAGPPQGRSIAPISALPPARRGVPRWSTASRCTDSRVRVSMAISMAGFSASVPEANKACQAPSPSP